MSDKTVVTTSRFLLVTQEALYAGINSLPKFTIMIIVNDIVEHKNASSSTIGLC